jgi:hypothetical protein
MGRGEVTVRRRRSLLRLNLTGDGLTGTVLHLWDKDDPIFRKKKE